MLADRLKRTVGELKAGMSYEESVRWKALFRVEEREREHQNKKKR